jgi:hypothetical protein
MLYFPKYFNYIPADDKAAPKLLPCILEFEFGPNIAAAAAAATAPLPTCN